MEYDNNTCKGGLDQMIGYCAHAWIDGMFIPQSNSHKVFTFGDQIPIVKAVCKGYLIRVIIILRDRQYFLCQFP